MAKILKDNNNVGEDIEATAALYIADRNQN